MSGELTSVKQRSEAAVQSNLAAVGRCQRPDSTDDTVRGVNGPRASDDKSFRGDRKDPLHLPGKATVVSGERQVSLRCVCVGGKLMSNLAYISKKWMAPPQV